MPLFAIFILEFYNLSTILNKISINYKLDSQESINKFFNRILFVKHIGFLLFDCEKSLISNVTYCLNVTYCN